MHSIRARALLTGFAIFLVSTSVVVVLWVGAQEVLTAEITPGRLGQFILYAVFGAGALGSLSEIGGEIAAASGAAERLFEILAIKPVIFRPAQPLSAARAAARRGRVRGCAISPIRRAPASRHSNRRVVSRPPGREARHRRPVRRRQEHDLSSLAALLRSGRRPHHARRRWRLPISIRRTLRARIALVPQDSVMFASSVRDNIRFGRPDASDADVARAAEHAHAAGFIAALPQGFDTPVGERGITLSGGQRQRIAIARAILRDAPLLLLDEATSSLDAESETQVAAALAELMRQRTTIVIAHRLATVLSCDRILVMEDGRIVEEGTHQTLAAAGGLYARLAKLQFQGA